MVKQRTPASKLLEQVAVPDAATELLLHVRDFTKGHPSIDANNHPVRHGPVVGVHNGRILNDDELLAEHACARAEPQMTVDSEAVFAVAAHSRSDARAFEAPLRHDGRGLARRAPARGRCTSAAASDGRSGSASAATGIFFASTEYALEVVEHYCGLELRKRAGRRRHRARRSTTARS